MTLTVPVILLFIVLGIRLKTVKEALSTVTEMIVSTTETNRNKTRLLIAFYFILRAYVLVYHKFFHGIGILWSIPPSSGEK